MEDRIARVFARLRETGTKALIPYVTPEYPFRGITVPLLTDLADAGADLLEVGMPFSDPLADGPTIQHSSEVGIRNGATIPVIFDAVREFRAGHETPVLLMGYVNLILHYGVDAFLQDAAAAGVDGLILPDLPPEEASEVKEQSERNGLSAVFLIAPTTPTPRISLIDRWSTHFSYCVSVTGVTGARTQLGSDGSLEQFLTSVRRNAKKPFVVGFGISTPEQVRTVWQMADGAVVGSAILKALGNETNAKDALLAAKTFFRSLRQTA